MIDMFLKGLIKRELEFKSIVNEKIEELSEEIKIINGRANRTFHESKAKGFIKFLDKSRFFVLKEDYDNLYSLCQLVEELITKDKNTYNKHEVDEINRLYTELSSKYNKNILFLKELLNNI